MTIQDVIEWMYQNLFTGKVRFENNGEPWGEVRLGDLVELKRSKHIFREVDTYKEGEYPFYSTQGIYKKVPFYDMEEEYIAINVKGSPGTIFKAPARSSFNNGFRYMTLKKEYDLNFLFYQLQRIHWDKYKMGVTDNKSLDINGLLQEKLPAPPINEQKKISEFMTTLGEAADQTRKELELWKKWKQGLMQQLFI